MIKTQRKIVAVISLFTMNLLMGCDAETPEDTTVSGRWYTDVMVIEGKGLYQIHCSVCHGESGQGTADWRKTDENDVYPPPPLNGTAHTWHHPMSALERTIAEGGLQFGGVMPGFRDSLDTNEVRAIIAYFQIAWSDDVYDRWHEINSR